MRRANVEEPIMKNDSIAVELRRKGSRIGVCKPSATKCPGIGGKPEMTHVQHRPEGRSSFFPKSSWLTPRRQFMQTFRVVANQSSQNSTSRSHICDSKKFMWARL